MPVWSRNFARTPLLLLATIEWAALFVAVHLGCMLYIGGIDLNPSDFGSVSAKASTVAGVMLLSMIAMGLYQFHQRAYFHEVFVRMLVGVAVGSIALAVIYAFFPAVSLLPRVAAYSFPIALILLLVVRFVFLRRVDNNVFRRRTLIFGAGDRASAIFNLRRRADRRGFQIVHTVAAPGDNVREELAAQGYEDESLVDIAKRFDVDEIVVAMDNRRGNLPIRELLDCKLSGINVIDLLEFLERETGKIHIDLVNPSWLIFSSGFRISRVGEALKRVVDISVSLLAAIITWPIMFLVAVAIKLEDGFGAPIIYSQTRVGLHGATFKVLKFRSMKIDAEPDGKAVWADKNDSRITRVGAFIRKARIDELPQIYNVLSGKMSLVGPRPERPEFVERLAQEIPYYAERHSVKPGVTGWAQLKYAYGSSKRDAEEKLRYDLYYVKNNSLLFDLVILLQTVEVILWGKGAR